MHYRKLIQIASTLLTALYVFFAYQALLTGALPWLSLVLWLGFALLVVLNIFIMTLRKQAILSTLCCWLCLVCVLPLWLNYNKSISSHASPHRMYYDKGYILPKREPKTNHSLLMLYSSANAFR
jgi:hypothetical protein